jgi:hypothetical protein
MRSTQFVQTLGPLRFVPRAAWRPTLRILSRVVGTTGLTGAHARRRNIRISGPEGMSATMERPCVYDDPITIDDLLRNHFLPYQLGSHRPPASLAAHFSIVDRLIVTTIGEMKVAELDAPNINGGMVQILREEGYSPSVIRRAVEILKAATEWGFLNGVIGRDPCRWIKPPSRRRNARYYYIS